MLLYGSGGRGLLGTGLLGVGITLGSMAEAQVVPPAKTIPEAPSLQNETLKPLDYRKKYDIYGGVASSHFNAGPALIPGANLGGFDVQGTMWLSMRFGVTANIRGYYGTTVLFPTLTTSTVRSFSSTSSWPGPRSAVPRTNTPR